MDEKQANRFGRFMSLVLRHKPEELDISLEPEGWTNVDALLRAAKGKGYIIDRAMLDFIVATDSKTRFSYSPDGAKIRANQGHSLRLDMDFEERTPPKELYHGTVNKALSAISKTGINKMQRHHVHLSLDLETARIVGSRRGNPVVLVVKSLEMHLSGHRFYLSQNGVWLVDEVPNAYIDWSRIDFTEIAR